MSLSQRISIISLSLLAMIFAFFAFALPTHAATITVNSTNAEADAMDGECNLEEAINSINVQSDQGNCVADISENAYGFNDTILFAIGVGGPVTISGNAILSISRSVTINGLSQGQGIEELPATCGTEDHMGDRVLYVTLDGFRLQTFASNTVIYGIVFAHNDNPLVFNDGSGHHVYCNNFGFDGFGQDTLGKETRNTPLRVNEVMGIEIGHTDQAWGNMFAGNTAEGTQTLPVWNSSNVTIRGNRFGVGGGVNPDVLGVGEDGGTHIAVEVISFNEFVVADKDHENIFIENNYIYDAAEGSAIIVKGFIPDEDNEDDDDFEPFSFTNVQIRNNIVTFSTERSEDLPTIGMEIQNNVIGIIIDGNEVVNFSMAGIIVQISSDVTVTNNTVESDFAESIGIGLGSVSSSIIGGVDDGNNVTAGESVIEIFPNGGPVENIIIQANTLTTINNDGGAVNIGLIAENILIGGTNPGEGNIMNGGMAGVSIFYSIIVDDGGAALDNIAVLGNQINSTNGIVWALDTTGPDEEFNFDIDITGPISNALLKTLEVTGPNRLIQHPEITGIIDNGDDTFTLTYELDVEAGDYRIEFYQDDEESDAGHGLGNNFQGFEEITHTGSGTETFVSVLPSFLIDVGDIVSATLTEIIPEGTNEWNFGATSQFSEQFVVVLAAEEQPTPTRRSSGSRAPESILRELGISPEAHQATIQSLMTEIARLQNILSQLTNNTPSPQTLICTPSLRIGSTGNMVRILQTKLGISSDGQFGPQTANAVGVFQEKNNLTQDKIAGPKTCSILVSQAQN